MSPQMQAGRESMRAIERRPHIKTLIEDGSERFLMIEPLQFFPIIQTATGVRRASKIRKR